MKKINFSNPKLSNDQNDFKFKYYAGYSSQFVEDAISYLNIGKDEVILDPWNGSGTTTTIASKMGYKCIGLDINPVMLLVAKSRALNKNNLLIGDLKKVLHSFRSSRTILIKEHDLLLNWFNEESVRLLRMFERAIQKRILKFEKATPLINLVDLNKLTSNSSFFYVIFFEVVKSFITKFKASNPTWIKKTRIEDDKITVSRQEISLKFKEIFFDYYNQLKQDYISVGKLHVSSSSKIELNNSSIDYVITSPPYCTRIDYAVATSVELAILGYDMEKFEELRLEMIGTTKILKNVLFEKSNWGNYANAFLVNVHNHSSKASKSYYYKQFLQYFDGIFKSFREIDRVLKSNGQVIIVVQDSYYKNLHLDLSKVYSEMSNIFSWKLVDHEKNIPLFNMSKINKNSKKYEKNQELVEHILVFRKDRGDEEYDRGN